MSMHLEKPYLTTTGKKKGKHKFRNAEEARKARELEASWKELQKKYASKPLKKESTDWDYKLTAPPGRETVRYESLDTGHKGAVKTAEIPQYTGTKIKGIGTMHKSNAVPIFSDDEAKDIANMRR